MLKPPRFLCTLLALTAGAWADTVILKNGEKVEGKILSETPTEIVVQVQVSASIKDERTIKKTDVAKVEKVEPDIEAWAQITVPALGDETLEPTDYVRAVNLLDGFVRQYPQSKHAAEAKEQLAKFQEEQKRVEAGEMKLDGKWLTKQQVQEERIQVLGRVNFNRMKRQASAGQLIEAMNTFDALEKNALGSASYPEAIVLARQILVSLKAAAEQRRVQLKAQAEENKRRLDNVRGPERQQLEALQKRQAALNETAVAAYERSGAKWLPLNPATDRSLGLLLTRINSDSVVVARADISKMKASVEAAAKARTALESGDVAAADEALTKGLKDWPQNEVFIRLQPKLLEAKAAMVAAKAKEASEAAAKPAELKKTVSAAATNEPPPVEDTPKKDDSSIFSKPAFWVILLVFLGLAGLVMKFLGKFSDPKKNILDQ